MSTEPPRPDESGESDARVGAATDGADGQPSPRSSGGGAGTSGAGSTATRWEDTAGDADATAWSVEGSAGRGSIAPDEVDRASRTYWEAEADAYQAEHGEFLAGATVRVVDSDHPVDRIDYADEEATGPGPGADPGAGFVWGPEGLTEDQAGLLGPMEDLVGRRVLEVGCGAAQCSAWLAQREVRAVGIDIAVNQMRHGVGAVERRGPGGSATPQSSDPVTHAQSGGFARQEPPPVTRLRVEGPGPPVLGTEQGGAATGEGTGGRIGPDGRQHRDALPGSLHLVAATATALPFPEGTFDAAFAAYGAIQFVGDLPRLLTEVRRVLVPGGRWVFSVTHPIRWAFPDDPGPAGLTANGSYFDRAPYVEREGSGVAVYAEFHRTIGDYVAALRGAGFSIDSIVEPAWPEWNDASWGGWSPLRGTHLPGTLIIGCRADALAGR